MKNIHACCKSNKDSYYCFFVSDSLKNNAPNIAEIIGASAIITKVLATLVFCIEIIKVILHAEKLIT